MNNPVKWTMNRPGPCQKLPLTLSLLQGRTEYVLYPLTHMLRYSACMNNTAHRKKNQLHIN